LTHKCLRSSAFFLTFVCVGAFGAPGPTAEAQPAPALKNLPKLPLAFERTQEGGKDRYVARGQGYLIGLENARATVNAASEKGGTSEKAVSLEFAGSHPGKPAPGPELPGKVNIIRGNDPQKWQIGLSTYERVSWPDVYPGIDVVYYGNQQQLEFDLVVKPGAEPGAIRLKVDGAEKLSIDQSGALDLGEAAGGMRVALPKLYQEVNGAKKSIGGHYEIVSSVSYDCGSDSANHFLRGAA
jgi:hypothetical protein